MPKHYKDYHALTTLNKSEAKIPSAIYHVQKVACKIIHSLIIFKNFPKYHNRSRPTDKGSLSENIT